MTGIVIDSAPKISGTKGKKPKKLKESTTEVRHPSCRTGGWSVRKDSLGEMPQIKLRN